MEKWEKFMLTCLADRGIKPEIVGQGCEPDDRIKVDEKAISTIPYISMKDMEERIGFIPGESIQDRRERIGTAYLQKEHDKVLEDWPMLWSGTEYKLPRISLTLGYLIFPWGSKKSGIYRKQEDLLFRHDLNAFSDNVYFATFGEDFVTSRSNGIESKKISLVDMQKIEENPEEMVARKLMRLSPQEYCEKLAETISRILK